MFGQSDSEKRSEQCAAEEKPKSAYTDCDRTHVTWPLYIIRGRQQLSIETTPTIE
jgi:hypothetical protein